jgi:hypothetical protein
MSFRSVARQIVGSDVRLRFDDFAGEFFSADAPDKDFTQEIGGNFKSWTGVERSG